MKNYKKVDIIYSMDNKYDFNIMVYGVAGEEIGEEIAYFKEMDREEIKEIFGAAANKLIKGEGKEVEAGSKLIEGINFYKVAANKLNAQGQVELYYRDK